MSFTWLWLAAPLAILHRYKISLYLPGSQISAKKKRENFRAIVCIRHYIMAVSPVMTT